MNLFVYQIPWLGMTMAEEYSNDGEAPPGVASPTVKMKMLVQMADALEDEAASFCHRAAGFEEEEFLLSRQVEERQTEIARLQLRIEGLRGQREGLFRRIDSLRTEAAAMKEEAFNSEDEIALAQISGVLPVEGKQTPSSGPVFFQRASLKDEILAR